jgi:hypothetical protein
MNLVKRVERLPKPSSASEAMQPLFEAISNSIHSALERFGSNVSRQGRIYVEVQTDRAKSDCGATVSDNGVGLDKRNYDAFLTTDTDNKTFAEYFSSDVAFDKLAQEFNSKDRPDLMIFDHVHGLRESDGSARILLIEFKHPGRTSFDNDENPQLQIERYIRKLQSGQEMDVRGRPITFNRDAIFYCYIVADIVGRMNEWTYSWGRTADGRGRVYQPDSGFKGTIELIGWDSLLEDAKVRNRAFFERAGIAEKNFFSEEGQ